MKLTVILDLSERGDSTGYLPGLAGCISEGNTKNRPKRISKRSSNFILNRLRTLNFDLFLHTRRGVYQGE